MLAVAMVAIALSGLQGTVTKGPTTPVCREGEPCTAPARVTLLFQRPGRAAVKVGTTALGTYRAILPAGYYTVKIAGIGRTRSIHPQRVHVRVGHLDRLDFEIDTGIR